MQYMAVIATRLPPYDAAPRRRSVQSRFHITVDEENIPLQRIWRAKAPLMIADRIRSAFGINLSKLQSLGRSVP